MAERFYYDELHETGSVSQVLGSRPVRYALVFSVSVLAGAFLLTPQLTDPHSQVNQLALNTTKLGVDPVTTGSISVDAKISLFCAVVFWAAVLMMFASFAETALLQGNASLIAA